MLVKYYGLDHKAGIPRCEFLINGLFRMTQPKFLNDKGSESSFLPYFNEFSPADLAWARKQYKKGQSNPNYMASDEELIRIFLKPMVVRTIEAFPYLLKSRGDYKTIDEFDESKFKSIVEDLNFFIKELLSCELGVFSLSKSDNNELMWNTYASEGKGIAVTFNDDHIFFKDNGVKDVSYLPEKRAFFTYYKGTLRLNGEPLQSFKNIDISTATISSIFSIFNQKDIDIMDLTERLLFSKRENWVYENEARIVLPLENCEEQKGEISIPTFKNYMSDFPFSLRNHHTICLKKIPFDAFDSIIFGYDISEENIKIVLNAIESNPELFHLKIKQAKHDVYGEVVVDIV